MARITHHDIRGLDYGSIEWTTTNLDWSNLRVRYKTLTQDETWTFINLHANKSLSVYVTGDYNITFPDYVKVMSGVYDGTVNNLIRFYCINGRAEEEIVVARISNLDSTSIGGEDLVPYYFQNKSLVTYEHNRFKHLPVQVEILVDGTTDTYEPAVPHKIERRENEMDIYIYPAMTGRINPLN